jgi:hypothetical protein
MSSRYNQPPTERDRHLANPKSIAPIANALRSETNQGQDHA